MSQLEYPSAFPPGSFFQNQALAQQGQYPGQQQQQQHQGQFQPGQQQFLHGAQQQQLQSPTHHLQGQQVLSPSHNQQQLQLQQQSISPDGMYGTSSAQSAGHLTSAPFPLSIPAGAAVASQQQRHSASPHQQHSPFASGTPQPQHQQIKYPMAAPPLPHTPINAQQPSALTTSAPSTPQSPNARSLDQSKAQLMLEINTNLLQEICNLQDQGKDGALNAQHQAQLKANNMDDRMATPDYVQTLRRFQANLAWLAPRNVAPGAKPSQKQHPGPAHMTPPPHMPQLQPKYDRLKELCPGWLGLDQMHQSGAASAAGQAPGLNGTSTA